MAAGESTSIYSHNFYSNSRGVSGVTVPPKTGEEVSRKELETCFEIHDFHGGDFIFSLLPRSLMGNDFTLVQKQYHRTLVSGVTQRK